MVTAPWVSPSNDAVHLGIHVVLTDTLVAEDGDRDGGIPAKPPDTDTMDQTWVANYLSVFGLSDFITPAAAVLEPGSSPFSPALYSEPNPFAGITIIHLSPARAGVSSLGVYDPAGRLVATLAAQGGTASWNGRDDDGVLLPRGVYFLRMGAGTEVISRRVVFVR